MTKEITNVLVAIRCATVLLQHVRHCGVAVATEMWTKKTAKQVGGKREETCSAAGWVDDDGTLQYRQRRLLRGMQPSNGLSASSICAKALRPLVGLGATGLR